VTAFSYVWPGGNFLFRFFVPRLMLLGAILLGFVKSVVAGFTGEKTLPCW
jgi:hypothetical protein